MNLIKQAAATLATSAALLVAGAAHADTTWAWSYSGDGVSASGTFVTAGTALVPEDILSITGTRNGVAILGLLPLDSDPNFIYDNQFTINAPHFSDGGFIYDIGGGDIGHINIYYYEGEYWDLYVDGGAAFEVPISFSVSAVPEASTYAYMALGLAGIGAFARRRKAKAA